MFFEQKIRRRSERLTTSLRRDSHFHKPTKHKSSLGFQYARLPREIREMIVYNPLTGILDEAEDKGWDVAPYPSKVPSHGLGDQSKYKVLYRCSWLGKIHRSGATWDPPNFKGAPNPFTLRWSGVPPSITSDNSIRALLQTHTLILADLKSPLLRFLRLLDRLFPETLSVWLGVIWFDSGLKEFEAETTTQETHLCSMAADDGMGSHVVLSCCEPDVRQLDARSRLTGK